MICNCCKRECRIRVDEFGVCLDCLDKIYETLEQKSINKEQKNLSKRKENKNGKF